MFTHHLGSFKRLLEKLKNKAEKAVIIVEGKKDKAALEALLNFEFLDTNHIQFVLLSKNKRSLQELAEDIASKHDEAIIMLDTDKKGRELAKKLTSYLRKYGVKTDRKIAEKILRLTKCRTVESLDNCKLARLL